MSFRTKAMNRAAFAYAPSGALSMSMNPPFLLPLKDSLTRYICHGK